MDRKLVTIREVNEILPIEGADFIELVRVDGWQTICKKGEFKVGSLGLYFEVDSFLPIDERYEFLRKSSFRKLENKEGFRLKTMKLKGQWSQGLLLPLTIFPEIENIDFEADYSELLNVTKYEPPLPSQLTGIAKGNFPSFIRKTDEERIQNLPAYFDGKLRWKLFEASEKIDGSSMTVYFRDGDFGVCSRNIDLKEDDQNSFWVITNELDLRKILSEYGRNIAIQGELAGPGIQKNRLKLDSLRFFIFNVWDIDQHRYMTPYERFIFLNKDLKIYDKSKEIWHVPVLDEEIFIFNECQDMKSLLERSERKSIVNPKVMLEGIVYKSCNLENGDVLSFKAINNRYLLEESD